jgi:hypothetical protein
LIFSTLIDGSGFEIIGEVRVNNAGMAFIAADTFPVTIPSPRTPSCSTLNGAPDGFFAKVVIAPDLSVSTAPLRRAAPGAVRDA